MDAHYFTAFCYEKIKQGLPNAKIKDSERLVNWARLVKSNTEISYMKSAAKISEIGMKTAFDVIKPGVRQCDAVGEIQKALFYGCLLYTSPSPRDQRGSRMPSSA